MTIKDGKLIYHLTPVDSLESIIRFGLRSRDDLDAINIDFIDTADQEILRERERLGLSQYIPFHFHIHTAYDTAVKHAYKNTDFAYICLHRDFARQMNYRILPIHPASNEQPVLYDYEEGLAVIDWKTMEQTILDAQIAGTDMRYHKQVRMAECLAFSPVSVSCFQSINVPNEEVRRYVLNLLASINIDSYPYINIRDWFV